MARGGQAGAAALKRSLSLESDLPALWTRQPPGETTRVAGSPLVTSELLITVGRSARVEVFSGAAGPEPLFSKVLPGAGEVVASPALLDDLLLVATQDRLYAADLIDLLEVSPGSGTRKRVIELQGSVCSHLASDGHRYAAVGTLFEESLYLHVFELTRQGLQLLWKRSPTRLEDPHAFLAMALVGDVLVAGDSNGGLSAYSIPDGRALGESRIPGALAPAPLLGRSGFALVAGADGAVYRLDAGSEFRALAVCEPSPQPLFALGASQEDVVTCHGRLLRRINLHSGRVSTLQIPQHCTVDPLVGGNRAVAVSSDGTAYLLEMSPDHFQVLASRKVLSVTDMAPPVASAEALYLVGSSGEVAVIPLQNQGSS